MKQTINFSRFTDAFRDMGRENSFSYQGKKALYGWIEGLDDDSGTETELDVIALDCEFCEYDDVIEAWDEYNDDLPEGDDDDEREESAIDWLRDRTTVIEVQGGGVIIQGF